MNTEDKFSMSQEDLKRLHVIHRIMDKTLNQIEASQLLKLDVRQVRRIIRRIQKEGDSGILHQSLGKPSHNATPSRVKDRVMKLAQSRYKGFNPTLLSEKLKAHEIALSDETLRRWLTGHYKARKPRPHRQWRERMRSFGQMLQMDGSHHDWLEARGPKLVLMAFVDDATGRIFGRFYDYEGTFPAMDVLKSYIRKFGIPQSVYLDKHTTYKSTAKPTPEEELKGLKPQSQFERALSELSITVIHAHSPQAKGRIERLFRTLQDRLVKEMRLANITTKDQANAFLDRYIPTYNRRFQVEPLNLRDLHRLLPKNLDLDRIFCIKDKRTLRNDFTLFYADRLYQIKEPVHAKRLNIEHRLDGSIRIRQNEALLRYKEILERPLRIKPALPLKSKRVFRPDKDHPWKERTFRQVQSRSLKTGHFNFGENRTF